MTAAAFFFVSMMSMASASAFFMTMTMVAASAGGRDFNVVLKRSGDESSNGDIAIAFVAGIKRDVGLRERLYGARSEAAANDAVDCIFTKRFTTAAWPWPLAAIVSVETIWPSCTS